MKFLDFKTLLEKFPVFTSADIQKAFPDFDRRRLVEWQQKGYIRKILKGVYYFRDYPVNDSFLYFVSNRIYKPSYVSLNSAMAYYNLIPEAVYLNTGISTLNTRMLETPLGNFKFRHVKPELFFGYKLVEMGGKIIKMAEPEKLILDYCYFNKIEDMKYIESLRLNRTIGKNLIKTQKLDEYSREYKSPVIYKRVKLFKEFFYAQP